jgi:thiosulfate/3-mercaptopyruvate sulfurtransferase
MAQSAALISTEELARRLGAPALRIFDCTTYLRPRPEGGYNVESGRANYDTGHVWKAENRPLATAATTYPPATLTLRGRPEIFVDKNAIKAAIGKRDTLTLNALSHEQHRGTGGVVYGRPGRIAGSSCVPAASLFGPDKALKPIAELRAAFDGVGAAAAPRVLVYCGGGIAATLDAFVLTAILGHKNVSVYDNSMQEWSNDASLPMETG